MPAEGEILLPVLCYLIANNAPYGWILSPKAGPNSGDGSLPNSGDGSLCHIFLCCSAIDRKTDSCELGDLTQKECSFSACEFPYLLSGVSFWKSAVLSQLRETAFRPARA